jgi:DNA-binding CsgD family transcriptional regulator
VPEHAEPDELALGEAQEAAATVYQALLEGGIVPVGDLARCAGLDPRQARAGLAVLEGLQLVRPVPQADRPGIEAVGTSVAELLTIAPIEDRIRELGERLRQMRSQLEPLQAVHRSATAKLRHSEVLTPLDEPAAILLALDVTARACQEEVMTVQPGGGRPEKVLESAIPRDTAMLARGVRMRTLYQHSARFSAPTQSYVEHLTAHGGEVRTRQEVGRRLLVFDRRVAFIPDHADDAKAVMVRHPALVAYLADTFEKAWDAALPFTVDAEARKAGTLASSMEKSVARLMLVERKDRAIARRLGISERTCRTYIARLMQKLGAINRTHLGYQLATREALLLTDRGSEPPDDI